MPLNLYIESVVSVHEFNLACTITALLTSYCMTLKGETLSRPPSPIDNLTRPLKRPQLKQFPTEHTRNATRISVMRLHLVTTLAALAPACLATFDDEAYKVDAQLSLLGLPQSENTFFAQPYTGSKASLVYTLSEKCVLGAVNPKDGAIVWRQQLKSHEECVAGGLLRAGGDQDTLVEASEGTVRAWSAADGRLAWERVFGPALSVADVQIPELAGGAEAKEKDVLVVLVGQRGYVQRLDGKTGKTKWAFLDEE